MKRERFEARGLWIETSRDWNGRYWIAWKPDVSLYFRERSVMVKWLAWPKGTPTRASLDSWLDSLAAADAEREGRSRDPQPDSPLSSELLATGFGPECHDIDNDNTRAVI